VILLSICAAEGYHKPVRLLTASAVVGLCTLSAGAANLRSEDAGSHIGETGIVCGVVASAKFEANARSQPTLLGSREAVSACGFYRGYICR
jgi:hypothetical protein